MKAISSFYAHTLVIIFPILKSKLTLYVYGVRVIPLKGTHRKEGLMLGIHACQKEVFLSNAEAALQDYLFGVSFMRKRHKPSCLKFQCPISEPKRLQR